MNLTASAGTDKQASTGGPDKECSGCGRIGHTGKLCWYKNHINFNRSGGPWSKSHFGPIFAKLGFANLPKTKCIDQKGQLVDDYTMPKDPSSSSSERPRKTPRRDNKSGMLAAIHEQIIKKCLDDTLSFSSVSSNDRLTWSDCITLFDNGARDDNYISPELVEKLQLKKEKILVRTQVCPVGSTCRIVEERVLIFVKLKNELTNQPFIFSTYANIYDGLLDQNEFELIIGKPCINEHRLVSILPYTFGLDDDSILKMAESIKAKSSVNQTEDTPLERSVDQVAPHQNAFVPCSTTPSC